MDFSYFTKMPMELQVEVWRHALHEEAKQRVVLLHDTHVIPRPSLISPLLSVDRMSRIEALRFYPVALKVVDLPKFVAPSFPREGPFGLRHRVRQQRMSLMFERRLDDLVPHSASRGTVRLSPAHDTFIIGLDFAPQYARKSLTHPASDYSDRDDGGKPSRPITQSLLDCGSTVGEIQKVVLAEWDKYARGRPECEVTVESEYALETAEASWNRAVFAGCATFQHLWLWGRGLHGSTRMLGDQASCARTILRVLDDDRDGNNDRGERGRLDIRSWTPVQKDDGSVMVVSRVPGAEDGRTPVSVETFYI
ncbi:hypothetical protein PG991_015274 [Apiospora marii]|uniref:2EXR domain-containing protein n=1 Tax=Apiospora marii TaxID=335849 RepID=A0ABR1R302_9PEZI